MRNVIVPVGSLQLQKIMMMGKPSIHEPFSRTISTVYNTILSIIKWIQTLQAFSEKRDVSRIIQLAEFCGSKCDPPIQYHSLVVMRQLPSERSGSCKKEPPGMVWTEATRHSTHTHPLWTKPKSSHPDWQMADAFMGEHSSLLVPAIQMAKMTGPDHSIG